MIEQMSDEELAALLKSEQPPTTQTNNEKILDIYAPEQNSVYQNISDEELLAALNEQNQAPTNKEVQKGYSESGDRIDTSIGRTILDQSLQGVPLLGTFTDEITSALGAGVASAYLNYKNMMPEALGGFAPGQKIDEFTTDQLFGDAEKLGNERVAAQLEENPGTALTSQIDRKSVV